MSASARDTDSDSEDVDVPTAAQCDQLCTQFSEITQVCSAEAIMHLQQNSWDLGKAIEEFYATKSHKTSTGEEKDGALPPIVKNASSSSTSMNTLDADKIRVLSWNLDGLDDVNLITRTEAAVKALNAEKPDVIYLQEVVQKSWVIIKEAMGTAYSLFEAGQTGYFTAMLMRKDTVWVDRTEIKPFYSSLMLRKLQIVHANIKGFDFKLMTSHLESTRQHAKERKRQLEVCMNEVRSADPALYVLFGGDLNLSAADLKGVTLPDGVQDMWECTGKRPEAQYTWDTKYNDNKQISASFKPRCRYDRMYFRQGSLGKVTPKHFELVGIEKVPNCSRFISDHWGILCHFHCSL